MSIHISAPFISFMIAAAICSATAPVSEPGNIIFISRSNIGISRFIESIPSGFIDGYISTIPLSKCLFSLSFLISS